MAKNLPWLVVVLMSLNSLAAPVVGQKPPSVTLSGSAGGRLSGAAWSSDELLGKVSVVFSIDPDLAHVNEAAGAALTDEKLPAEKFQSVAVVNMAATWLPNFAIDQHLRQKQKQYPDTAHVRDLRRSLVRAWDLADDGNAVLVLDRQGRVLFVHEGRLDAASLRAMIQAVRAAL